MKEQTAWLQMAKACTHTDKHQRQVVDMVISTGRR